MAESKFDVGRKLALILLELMVLKNHVLIFIQRKLLDAYKPDFCDPEERTVRNLKMMLILLRAITGSSYNASEAGSNMSS